jgi:hypothetical protein
MRHRAVDVARRWAAVVALGAAVVALGTALLTAPALAHHSYAMFEQREIRMQGTVKAFEWTNPHIFIQLLVPSGDGQAEEWSIEGSGPGDLARQGWKFNTLKAGETVTVGVAPLRDGRKGGGLIFVQKADGTRLSGGPLSRLDPAFQRGPGQ